MQESLQEDALMCFEYKNNKLIRNQIEEFDFKEKSDTIYGSHKTFHAW